MPQTFSEELGRIHSHLNLAEFYEANAIVEDLRPIVSSGEEEIGLKTAEAMIKVHTGQPVEANRIVTELVNGIANWAKSVQLQILHVASQVTYRTNSIQYTRVYIDKFLEIYGTISPVLQERSTSIYGDVINIEGLLLYSEGEYAAALPLFEEATQLHRRHDKPFQLAVSLFNAGKTANSLSRLNRAELFLVESYNIFKEIDYTSGQLQAAEELVTTYELQSDTSAKLSYVDISRHLRKQVEIQQHEQESRRKINTLQKENLVLQQQVISLQSQIENRDRASSDRDEEIKYLKSKLKDFHDIKSVYSSFKEQIKQMEQTIDSQKERIEELELELRRTGPSPVIVGIREAPIKSSLPSNHELDELIASDKLIDAIYYKLREITSTRIKLLAMQLRVSTPKCETAVKNLEEIGALTVDSWENDSPTVTINSK